MLAIPDARMDDLMNKTQIDLSEVRLNVFVVVIDIRVVSWCTSRSGVCCDWYHGSLNYNLFSF